MDDDRLIWYEKPILNKPYMIMAFTGWANAGDVSSSILWYLITRFEASLCAELKPDQFYNYQTTDNENKRPIVNIENGMIQSFSLVTTNFWCHKNLLGQHDIIFISGPEPDHGWNEFTELILGLAVEYQVEKIITIGGTFDAIPHTAPPKISAVVSHSDLKIEVEEQGIELISYKGPSSIHSYLMLGATKKEIPMISIWSHTPHYIQVTNFIACYNVMLKISGLLDLKIDLEVARNDSEYLYTQIDQAIEKKPELQEYLKTLESEYRKGNPYDQTPISKNVMKEIEDLFKDTRSQDQN